MFNLNEKISGIVAGILLSILTLWLIGFFGPFPPVRQNLTTYILDTIIFGISLLWVAPLILPILCFLIYKRYKTPLFKFMFIGSLLAPLYSLGFLFFLVKFSVS